jgi:hypothetical protein
MSTFHAVHAEQFYLKGQPLELPTNGDGVTIAPEIKFKVVVVLDNTDTFTLPDPADIPESGLYFVKDELFASTDTTFKLHTGEVVGRMYHDSKQTMMFLKVGGVWRN